MPEETLTAFKPETRRDRASVAFLRKTLQVAVRGLIVKRRFISFYYSVGGILMLPGVVENWSETGIGSHRWFGLFLVQKLISYYFYPSYTRSFWESDVGIAVDSKIVSPVKGFFDRKLVSPVKERILCNSVKEP